MVSLFLVLDIFIDMIYIAIIGLELYFYITFDEDYIDIYFFFYRGRCCHFKNTRNAILHNRTDDY